MCDNANKKLTSSMVNTFYDILESGTFDDISEKQPAKDMDKLLSWYDSLSNISFEKIVEFLVRFEKLKPFNNDNGIIGRMIVYKECLKNDIFPFIIFDKDKQKYNKGLDNYLNKKETISICKNYRKVFEVML